MLQQGSTSVFLFYFILEYLDIKAHGSKAVVTGYHCRLWIFHPTVVEVSATVCKGGNEGKNTLPRAIAKALRLVLTVRDKHLSHSHIAGVLYGIFISFYQVVVAGDFHYGYATSFHTLSPLYPKSSIGDKPTKLNIHLRLSKCNSILTLL